MDNADDDNPPYDEADGEYDFNAAGGEEEAAAAAEDDGARAAAVDDDADDDANRRRQPQLQADSATAKVQLRRARAI